MPSKQDRLEVRALHVAGQGREGREILLLALDDVDPAHPLLLAVTSPQRGIFLPEAVDFAVGLPVGGGGVKCAAKVSGDCESKIHINIDSA